MYIQQKKSAEWIAKKMKLDVKTVKSLMSSIKYEYDPDKDKEKEKIKEAESGPSPDEEAKKKKELKIAAQIAQAQLVIAKNSEKVNQLTVMKDRMKKDDQKEEIQLSANDIKEWALEEVTINKFKNRYENNWRIELDKAVTDMLDQVKVEN